YFQGVSVAARLGQARLLPELMGALPPAEQSEFHGLFAPIVFPGRITVHNEDFVQPARQRIMDTQKDVGRLRRGGVRSLGEAEQPFQLGLLVSHDAFLAMALALLYAQTVTKNG